MSWLDLDPARFRGARVGLLQGGRGAERPISLKTGQALADALKQRGYQLSVYDFPSDLPRLVASPPEVALLALHGDGEGGSAQGLLEALGVPYTGSGVLASALCMDKHRAKAVMRSEGVPLAQSARLDFEQLKRPELFERLLAASPWCQGGYVLKPVDSGSSHGVFVLQAEQDFGAALAQSLEVVERGEASAIMLEERMIGPEYAVGFFDGEALGTIQITPAEGFYDFKAKYQSDQTRYEPVEPERAEPIERAALAAWRALGCRGVGRIDLMAHAQPEGVSVRHNVLEANTIPGMTATSLVPKLASSRGVAFEDFVELMLAAARLDAPRGAVP